MVGKKLGRPPKNSAFKATKDAKKYIMGAKNINISICEN
jgi:hypothetical protein